MTYLPSSDCMTTGDGHLVVHDVEFLVELTNANLLSKHDRIAQFDSKRHSYLELTRELVSD